MSKRPRGRPKKPVESVERRKVGRPRVSLREDGDRYHVALFFALTTVRKMSDRKAALLVAGLLVGKEVEPDSEFTEKHKRLGNSAVAVGYEKISRPGAPSTFEGKASTIRAKARGPLTVHDAEWLEQMSLAFSVTLDPANVLAKYLAFQLAASVGEKAFAVKVLGPMIDAKIGPGQTLLDLQPDFLGNFLSTTNAKM